MKKGITDSWLKVIACVSMLIDHMASHVFKGMDWAIDLVHGSWFRVKGYLGFMVEGSWLRGGFGEWFMVNGSW